MRKVVVQTGSRRVSRSVVQSSAICWRRSGVTSSDRAPGGCVAIIRQVAGVPSGKKNSRPEAVM
ncbi:hypothetical protein QF034_000353 [Streptomyces africanus]|uniref:Uncharacterized protein n=1 Tax=Streptomyces africanus TaxID=231024 RepID=A0ABU0QFE8_9ACTN|nr:hypothetical protein [Streptomyces africanus]